MRQKRLVLLSTRGNNKTKQHTQRKITTWTGNHTYFVWRCEGTQIPISWWGIHVVQHTERVWDMNADFFLMIYWLSRWWKKENDPRRCLCMCVCACACVRCVNSIPSESSWWSSNPSLSPKPHTGTLVPQDDRNLSWSISSSWYYRPKKTCALGRSWVHWNVYIAHRDGSLFEWRKPAHWSHCFSSLRELCGLKSFFGREIFVLLLLVILY